MSDCRSLAMICNLVKLQIRFEYHMFSKISKVMINSSDLQLAFSNRIGKAGRIDLLLS